MDQMAGPVALPWSTPWGKFFELPIPSPPKDISESPNDVRICVSFFE